MWKKTSCSGRGYFLVVVIFLHSLMCFVVCFVCFSSFSNCCKANKSCPGMSGAEPQIFSIFWSKRSVASQTTTGFQCFYLKLVCLVFLPVVYLHTLISGMRVGVVLWELSDKWTEMKVRNCLKTSSVTDLRGCCHLG